MMPWLRQACCRFALPATLLATLGCRTIPGQDVRYQPTPMPVVRAMLDLAKVGPGDVVYDLGSGDGRIVITAARELGARGVGIEIDPALVARAQANAGKTGIDDKVEFRLGDMYTADVRPATVVTLFLHPGPNLKLRPKLRAELRPGARIVSYIWDMDDWPAEEVRRVNRRQIYLWRIPRTAATPFIRPGRWSGAMRSQGSSPSAHHSSQEHTRVSIVEPLRRYHPSGICTPTLQVKIVRLGPGVPAVRCATPRKASARIGCLIPCGTAGSNSRTSRMSGSSIRRQSTDGVVSSTKPAETPTSREASGPSRVGRRR